MNTAAIDPVLVNDVNVDQLQDVIGTIEQDTDSAKTHYRARCKWRAGYWLTPSNIKSDTADRTR